MKIVSTIKGMAITAALGCCLSAGAQTLYKCKSPSGSVQFTDAPCAGGGEQIKARVGALDMSGSRELSLRQENERLREQLQQQQSAQATSAKGSQQRTQSDLQADRIDSFACEKAKRDYEVTSNSRSNSQEIIEAKRSMMYGTCGIREPDRNTIVIDNRINVR